MLRPTSTLRGSHTGRRWAMTIIATGKLRVLVRRPRVVSGRGSRRPARSRVRRRPPLRHRDLIPYVFLVPRTSTLNVPTARRIFCSRIFEGRIRREVVGAPRGCSRRPRRVRCCSSCGVGDGRAGTILCRRCLRPQACRRMRQVGRGWGSGPAGNLYPNSPGDLAKGGRSRDSFSWVAWRRAAIQPASPDASGSCL